MKSNDKCEIIELNVGGSVYATSRTTILSYPDSMLHHMVNGQIPSATDSQNRIFIDRDGPLFRYILNFLRDKRLNLPDNFTEYAQLRQEADFYRIDPIITQLDSRYCTKSALKYSSRSPSLTSLAGLSLEESSSSPTKGVYFTMISKLYQGSLISLIGCIRVLAMFTTLDANSKRFMSFLLNQNQPNGASNNNGDSQANSLPNKLAIDFFVCECKFMHEEKLICCKPCGLSGPTDPKLVSLSQTIVRIAKRCGLSTSYWEDMFYLSMDASCPNREHLSTLLNDKHNGRLLTSSVCDHRSSYDENNNSTLIERWFLPDSNSLRAVLK